MSHFAGIYRYALTSKDQLLLACLWSVAELYTSTQVLSSDHSSSVGSLVMRRYSWMPMMLIPTSEQPMNNWWVFPCWCKVLTLYVDITRALKVDRQHDSGPTVCDVVPSSRWPVMESSGDGHPSAFDRSFGIFLIVFVIKIVPDLFSPFWKPCSTGDRPWTAYGVLNRLTRDESWSLVTCSAPPYWRLRYSPLTAIDSDDVAMGVGAPYNLCLDGWWTVFLG